MDSFQLRGNLLFFDEEKKLNLLKNKVLLVKDGLIAGIKDEPEKDYPGPLYDYQDKLILPGMSDLHAHASQYPYRGVGSDKELIEWLSRYAYPTESRYQDLSYAEKSYEVFTEHLRKSYTTRITVFTTIHKEASLLLMKKMEEKGLAGYVGLVNIDQNAPDYYRHKDATESLRVTREFLEEAKEYSLVKPIITPRFAPSCDEELLKGLGQLAEEYSLPVQSHLDETISEVAWVKELFPNYESYTDVYYKNHLFGNPSKTVMAHCIWNTDEEIKRLKDNGVYVAHCPECNFNLMSGIAPIRKYLDNGIHVGLGSDVSGGTSLDLTLQVREAMHASKMRSRYLAKDEKPLSLVDAFYLATLGGGSFFGKVGSFLEGYQADILVIEDEPSTFLYPFDLEQRLEHFLQLPQETKLLKKFISGREVYSSLEEKKSD